MVAVTGRREAYYTDYRGTAQELVSAAKWGYLYQGQLYRWQRKRRGFPALDIEPAAFVNYLQNHDQVANSAKGERLHQLIGPGRLRAVTAYLILAPGTPMLLQGQEFAASAPFLYFADHVVTLGTQVRRGRREFLAQFRSLATSEARACLPDPGDPATFVRCKLDHEERIRNAHVLRLHRDLLALRRSDPVFRRPAPRGVDGAVLAPETFVLRSFGGEAGDRLLLVNLGVELHLNPAPEPLLAPPDRKGWRLLWSSEAPAYGGCGTGTLESHENWCIPAHAAFVLGPEDILDPRP